MERNDESVFDLDHVGHVDAPPASPEATSSSPTSEDWYAQLQASGLPVTALEDQQWGIREFTLTDPSGNHIRIGKSTPDSD